MRRPKPQIKTKLTASELRALGANPELVHRRIRPPAAKAEALLKEARPS